MPFCEAEEKDQDALNAFAEYAFKARKVQGGAVIIAEGDDVLFSYAYGYRDAQRTQPVTLDTCFRVASVTKLVTAIGLMQLYEQGLFSLDEPLSDILPFLVVNPVFPDIPITARQVLSHTSSFKQMQRYFPNWEKLAKTKTNTFFEPKVKPGTKYIYSNMNGGLFGAMIESLSAQSVNAYMTDHIFSLLNINAAYAVTLLKDQTDIADGLEKSGKLFRSVSHEMREYADYEDTCDPRAHTDRTVGNLYISASGLSKLAQMLACGGTVDGVALLSPDTILLMEQEQDTIDGSTVTCKSPYGLGMMRVDGMTGGTWYGHQGRMNGLTSNLYYQTETGLSVVVIANGYNGMAIDGVVSIARVFMEKAEELRTISKGEN